MPPRHLLFPLLIGVLATGMIVNGGCRRRSREEESQQQRRARAVADRRAAMAYLKKDGQVDWRKRVDAASEALDQAKSDRRWGRNDEALQHALECARLLPPAGKDFDAISDVETAGGGETSGDGASDDDASGGGTGAAGGSSPRAGPGARQGAGGLPSADPSGRSGLDGEGEGSHDGSPVGQDRLVTNDEVRRLRESLQSLLESLDGTAGRSRSNLNVERDAIEIR